MLFRRVGMAPETALKEAKPPSDGTSSETSTLSIKA
jgi:hypothetical protein